jgi:hypothetical protein
METMEAFAKVAKMQYQTTSHFDGWVISSPYREDTTD